MAAPEVEAVAREFTKRFNDGDLVGSAALFAEPSLNHGMRVTRAQIEAVLRSLRQALPDSNSEIIEMISDGEVVVYRLKVTGTHAGTPEIPFVEGGVFAAAPPRHTPIETTHTHWMRVRGDHIVEHWANRDDLGVARQLGLVEGIPSR